ncbi:MAG: aminotransferase class I/II-fold pyridoxal phosphate-dependent enzyme [Rhodospirillales bacterium]
MLNPRLRLLSGYPFDRLRALLDGIEPPAGRRPMVLSVGEPRHLPPPLVREVVDAGGDLWNRYPPVEGTAEFRSAAAGWLRRRYALPERLIDADSQILPVAGTREALFLCAAVAVPPGDGRRRPAVLMPNPFYHVYDGAALMSGADPVYLPATRDTRFLPDLDAIAPAILDRTALMYLCSPANPQGAVADLDYLTAAVRLARRHDFVLAVDECYTEIWDRHPPPGALQACAAMGGDFGNVLVFHSLSKRSSVPGLRCGFVAGDARLVDALRRLRSYGGATVPLPVLAAATALWGDDDHVERNRALYRAKFDLAERLLGGRFGFFRPQGAFFLWLEVGDGEEAARALWAKAALRVLPGRYLAQPDAAGANPGDRFVRVALIEDPASTEEALRRIVNTL